MRGLAGWAIVVTLVAGCSRPPEGSLRELHKATVGDLEVVLLAPADTLEQRQGFALVEFRDENGMLVDVGTVKASATMPMPGAETMTGGIGIKPTPAPGRFELTTDFSMGGVWFVQVEWIGPAGQGSARLQSNVR